MNFKNILSVIFIIAFVNLGLPSLLTFLNIDVNQYYTPFQIFIDALFLLYIALPKNIENPFIQSNA